MERKEDNDLTSRGEPSIEYTKIITCYEKYFGKEITCLGYLPDKEELAEIISLLRKLIFPGYFNNGTTPGAANMSRDLSSSEACNIVQTLISDIRQKLNHQICRALNLAAGQTGNCHAMAGKAEEKCAAFLETIPEIIEILSTDVQATYDGDPAAKNKHEIIFTYPGIFAISIYRLAHRLHLLSVPFIPRMMTEHAHSLTGIDIHPGADIGPYFCIDHGTGIVIGETTEIGTRVKLYQGVTIGALSTRGGQDLRGRKRHPTLEDDVIIYSGATILGGETVIGKGCVIGGNVFITESVPPDTRVNMKNRELEYKKRKNS